MEELQIQYNHRPQRNEHETREEKEEEEYAAVDQSTDNRNGKNFYEDTLGS